jgi:Glu-tRNA(Gln) amidotransferase subunit E-like FAD-binding protein
MEVDYKEIGFCCGIEVHQQLSNKKLFCNCSTKFQENDLDLEFSRKLRATAGEQGYIDVAAQFEESKNMEFVYHGYKDEYCLVDCDEQPPYQINQDALITALSICKLLKLDIPDEIQVMRKIITDGSACSSFQRTALIGYESKNSYLETSLGKVRITSLCLEEDACKIEKVEQGKIYYSLSRQGIPLVEIRTEPDIKNPEHAKETAEKLGMILRSFSSILRGIGTIRQDVNLSIKNGNRVEIKGFQELRNMPKIIDFEIQRQVNILKQGKNVEKEVRKANENGTTSFLRPLPGASRMYPETDIPQILITNDLINKIKIPELIEDRINNLEKKFDLSYELASEIIKNKIDFDFYSNKFKNIKPGLLSGIILTYQENPNLLNTLDLLNSGKITKDVFDEAIKGNFDSSKKISLDEVEQEAKKIIKEKQGLSTNAIMGILMGKFKGKIEGKKLIDIINKIKK